MQQRRTTGLCAAVTASVAVALLSVPISAGGASATELAPAGAALAPSIAALAWTSCPTEAPAPPGEVGPTLPVECATLPVPLDHADPGAGTVDLAVFRLVTADPAQRLGSLVMNPGGPGSPTLEFLTAISQGMPPELTDRYDLVTFDPRGVGESEGLTCGTGQDLTASLNDPIGDQLRFAAELAAACQAEAAELVPTMTTANVARDLDVLRQALGDDRLHYLGFSWGTRLGSVYAELHPDRVGRLVLDGAMDPSARYLELMEVQIGGMERSLQRFFGWCDTDSSCRFAGTSAEAVWEHLAWRSTLSPLPTADGRQVTASEFLTGSLTALYIGEPFFPILGDGLRAAFEGDAALFADLYRSYVDVSPAGTYYAFMCGDDASRHEASIIQSSAWRLIDEAPHTYWMVREVLTCTSFAAGDTPLPEVALTEGEIPPVLVVGNVGDPATPYHWAVALREALGGSRLLTFDGDGHTITFQGVPCIDDAVVAYLVAGDLPAPGTVCAPPAPPAPPA